MVDAGNLDMRIPGRGLFERAYECPWAAELPTSKEGTREMATICFDPFSEIQISSSPSRQQTIRIAKRKGKVGGGAGEIQ